MANEEHLKILKSGVQTWNKWWKDRRRDFDNPTWPDLRGADLRFAKLTKGCLVHADLEGADLEGADLRMAELGGARLNDAKLNRANLAGADLTSARFRTADLTDASLTKARLNRAKFEGAVLKGVDLTGQEFKLLWWKNSNLSGAILKDSNFNGQDLSSHNLTGAILRDANLREANLVDTMLDDADISGAWLWGTNRDGWSIKNVICDHVYWDRDRKEATEYSPGEFERAHAEKPQIRIVSPGMEPIDLAMLPLILERLQDDHPESSLYIRRIEDEGLGHPTITIVMEDRVERPVAEFQNDKAAMERQIQVLLSAWQDAREERDYFRRQNEQMLYRLTETDMGNRTYNIKNDGQMSIEVNVNIKKLTNSTNSLDEIKRLVEALLNDQSQWKSSVRQDSVPVVHEQLEAIKSAVEAEPPNQSMITAGLASLKTIVEGAAEQAAYGGLLQALIALAPR